MNIEKNVFAEGTDVRIMSTNILAKRWSHSKGLGDVPPIEQRAEVFASVLASCAPDVVGVQESDQPWIDIFPQHLERLKNDYGIEYKWMFTDYLDRQTLTTILYRSDKYELVDSGIDNFSIWKTYEYDRRGYNLRLVCWVMLTDKNNKENTFILTNTHWGDEDKAGNVAEEAELVNLLRAKYGVPVFCTGDFNARETTDEYARFMMLTGAKSTREVAAECGTLANKTGGIGKLGMSREEGSFYIDHIFGVGNYNVLKYETILGNACFLSDHSPHIADIKFN